MIPAVFLSQTSKPMLLLQPQKTFLMMNLVDPSEDPTTGFNQRRLALLEANFSRRSCRQSIRIRGNIRLLWSSFERSFLKLLTLTAHLCLRDLIPGNYKELIFDLCKFYLLSPSQSAEAKGTNATETKFTYNKDRTMPFTPPQQLVMLRALKSRGTHGRHVKPRFPVRNTLGLSWRLP